ncbi:toxin glutamine deamidase domain-containing protein [Streptomyces endophytica]|uniref:Toxin glutamine deamidase domain-containing protein n=1 Tax=Streptomyces endophytica TaxID=2991496 RepID=A0ABY6PE72_9ACTN|nr:toxin glutamine deamidase domain-containing protein [Streptomyces endophytica]UZJ31477.1 toxin glutamine deamidase domain-containing protein [Streptomyces endophytica]
MPHVDNTSDADNAPAPENHEPHGDAHDSPSHQDQPTPDDSAPEQQTPDQPDQWDQSEEFGPESLDSIRDSLDYEPGGLQRPDPSDQQALEDAHPRNPDGTPQLFADPFEPWSQLQNDGGHEQPGRSNNCADCSRSFLESWYGNPQVSAPRTLDTEPDGTPDNWSPEDDSVANLERWAGGPFVDYGDDASHAYQNIAAELDQAGHGSAAVVGVYWPEGGGHAFNAVNHNGKVIWVDSQTGEVSDAPIHLEAGYVVAIPLDADGNPIHPWESDSESDAPEQSADAPEQSADGSEQSADDPEQSGDTSEQSGDTPDNGDVNDSNDSNDSTSDNDHPESDDAPTSAEPADLPGPAEASNPTDASSPTETPDDQDGTHQQPTSEPKAEGEPKTEGEPPADTTDPADTDATPAKDTTSDTAPEPHPTADADSNIDADSDSDPDTDSDSHADADAHPDAEQESSNPAEDSDQDSGDAHKDTDSNAEGDSSTDHDSGEFAGPRQDAEHHEPTFPAEDTRPYDRDPGGLVPPNPDDQQALEHSVPRNEDGSPQRHPDPNEGTWVNDVNGQDHGQPGRTNNCPDAALSFADTYSGHPTVAAARTPDHNPDGTPSDRGESGGRDRMESTLGARFTDHGDGPDAFRRLETTLLDNGHGSQAVVITQDANGRAHAWNVVNHNGKITYVDPQTGRRSDKPLHSGDHGVFAIPLDPNRRPIPAGRPTNDGPGSPNARPNRDNGSPANQGTASPTDRSTPSPAHRPGVSGTPHHDAPAGEPRRAPAEPAGTQHTPDDDRADATREERNKNLPDPESTDQVHNDIPADASQASLRDHEQPKGHKVYRIDDLEPVYAHLRNWCEVPKDSEGNDLRDKDGHRVEPPLAQLLRLAAQRRLAAEQVTQPVNATRKALDDARQRLNAAEKSRKDAKDNVTQAHHKAVKDAQDAVSKAAAAHDKAFAELKQKNVPPAALTEKELRDLLGKNFAEMDDGQRHVVVATIARMSLSFHANNAVGSGPERMPGNDSPYQGSKKASGDPDPAETHHDSVGARRRTEAKPKFPREFRRQGTDSDKAFKNLQAEHRASGNPHKIDAVLAASFPNTPDFTDKNFAVIEVVDKDGNSTYVIDSSVPAMTDGVTPRHSERHLLDWMGAINGADGVKAPYNIAGLYTEREPCGLRAGNTGHADCSQTIRDADAMTGVPVYYSTTYRDDSPRERQRLLAERDELLADMGDLTPAQQQKELQKEGLTDKQIEKQVEKIRLENKKVNDAEIHGHLEVVGELWSKVQAQMVKLERERNQAQQSEDSV